MGSASSTQKSRPPSLDDQPRELVRPQAVQNNQNEKLEGLPPMMPLQAVQNNENEIQEGFLPLQAVQNNENEITHSLTAHNLSGSRGSSISISSDENERQEGLPPMMPLQAVQNNENEIQEGFLPLQAVQNNENERQEGLPPMMPIQAVQNNENERQLVMLRPQAVQNNENEKLEGGSRRVPPRPRRQAVQNNENEKLVAKSQHVPPRPRRQAVQNNQNEKKEADTAKKGGQKALSRLDSSSEFGQDVMISYSHQDMDFMRKMRGSLEASGISVWVDEQGLGAGVDFLNKIGHAIVEAKVFLSLLSPNSVTSKYCKDELALAYISNKPIFPVAMATRDSLRKNMDFGMQLTLAPMEWVDFSDRDSFDVSFAALVHKFIAATKAGDESKAPPSKAKPKLERPKTRQNLNKMTRLNSNPMDDESDFWERAFKDAKDVPWSKFIEAFDSNYSSLLDGMQISSDSEHKDWLMTVLKREMTVDNNVLSRESYDEFCFVGGVKLPFWQRVHEQAVESYTMREVFQMDSSVRLSAIEDLAKYRSKAVVDALLDLLNDTDPNVRAVAAVTLAKSGNAEDQEVIKRLLKTLQDKDRLVRESGCIALGYLRAKEAVPQLVHLWRNDTISTVREAASVSLEKIGGEEAEKAIHMTKVLSEEIKLLMQQSMQKQT
ncbi:uncharacterized protein LOC118425519 isoform X3 [Branchiostoma floridae]|uniref:Uncharacterized protein LOC118425519 isoform X2 n=1 Tax=Branchiostoma floridae TaxID=7739 RepID=A0A9J7N5H3_BRAFL|nr:uncharacterized protein LOC118425519 isoform X2 [Branchiostoma floridae]XP_035690301.1 uncharacterized protein LOC118425519 isoform X3 [Branchiostoma floridae]